jgi:hypothetical protein
MVHGRLKLFSPYIRGCGIFFVVQVTLKLGMGEIDSFHNSNSICCFLKCLFEMDYLCLEFLNLCIFFSEQRLHLVELGVFELK